MGIIASGIEIKCDVCGKGVSWFSSETKARCFAVNCQWIFFDDLVFCGDNCRDAFFYKLYQKDQNGKLYDSLWENDYKKLIDNLKKFARRSSILSKNSWASSLNNFIKDNEKE